MDRSCPNCESHVTEDDAFCSACGHPLEHAGPAADRGGPSAKPREREHEATTPRAGAEPAGTARGPGRSDHDGARSKTSRRLVLVGAAGVAGAGFLWYGSNDDDGNGGGTDLGDGGTVHGTITEGSPRDPVYDDLAEPHRFQASAGDRIVVSMTSSDVDSFLVVTGPSGDGVAQDDDGGSGLDSRLSTTVSETGTYTAWAGTYSGLGTGNYTLSVTVT